MTNVDLSDGRNCNGKAWAELPNPVRDFLLSILRNNDRKADLRKWIAGFIVKDNGGKELLRVHEEDLLRVHEEDLPENPFEYDGLSEEEWNKLRDRLLKPKQIRQEIDEGREIAKKRLDTLIQACESLPSTPLSSDDKSSISQAEKSGS